ncbi:MAG: SAM-dependent methyltransferase [Candidatus Promineifilaceae bacterium]|jgi:SAM-dependent methyltransferase
MPSNQTDADWEWFGKNDPYYGVVSWDCFRENSLDDATKAAFFQHGEDYVQDLLRVIRERVSADFVSHRALDFGCGVGRITIPLAKRWGEVVGVDVSPSMLQHARANCEEMGVENARFIETQELDGAVGGFDFVHSFIVFQHMPVSAGEAMTRKLIDLLSPDGVGALHYTYRHHSTRSFRSRFLLAVYRHIPLAYKFRSLLKREPVMEMNEYDINAILAQLQDAGCGQAVLHFTDHQCRGVVIMFQKKKTSSESNSRGQ